MAPKEQNFFGDWSEAWDFFHEIPFGHLTNSLLRVTLAEEYPGLDVSQLDDNDLGRELAARIHQIPYEVGVRGYKFWHRSIPGGLPGKAEPKPESGKAEAPPSPIKPAKPKTWIKFRVRDDVMEEPIPGVQLRVKFPDGTIKNVETDKKGEAAFKNIDEGKYDVSCDLKGAKRKSTLDYVSIAPGPDEWNPPEIPPDQRRYKPGIYIIADVEAHHVQTGESIESLANANGMTWQDLSIFNWGTSVPKEINKHLVEEVGVTAKAPDGINWSFRTEDNPGMMYIPSPWKAEGLATELTHEIRVKKDNEFLIILQNMKELRVPESDYEATFSDGTLRKGTTGRNGGDKGGDKKDKKDKK